MIELITALFNERYGIEQAYDFETVETYYNYLRHDLEIQLHDVKFWITYKQETIDSAEQLQRLLISYDSHGYLPF